MKEKLNLKDLEKEIIKESIQIGELNGKKVIFDPNISCDKVFMACKNIVNTILKPDGTYFPELKNILIFCFIIQNMTNIPIKKDKEGNLDTDFIYKLMESEIGKNLRKQLESDSNYNFLSNEIQEVLNYKKEIYLRKIASQNETLQNLDILIFQMQNAVQKIISLIDESKHLLSKNTINKIIETLDKTKNNH